MSAPKPPRRSLFAVWHWPRWTWVLIIVLCLEAWAVLSLTFVQFDGQQVGGGEFHMPPGVSE
jgi:hypothetical protein